MTVDTIVELLQVGFFHTAAELVKMAVETFVELVQVVVSTAAELVQMTFDTAVALVQVVVDTAVVLLQLVFDTAAELVQMVVDTALELVQVFVDTAAELVEMAVDTIVVLVKADVATVLDTTDTESVLALFWLVDRLVCYSTCKRAVVWMTSLHVIPCHARQAGGNVAAITYSCKLQMSFSCILSGMVLQNLPVSEYTDSFSAGGAVLEPMKMFII